MTILLWLIDILAHVVVMFCSMILAYGTTKTIREALAERKAKRGSDRSRGE